MQLTTYPPNYKTVKIIHTMTIKHSNNTHSIIMAQTSNRAKAFLKEMLAAGPPLIPPAAIMPSTSAIHAYIRHSLKGLSVRQATVNSNNVVN